MILIKINEVPNDKDLLRERVSKHWRINTNRLYNQDKLIAVHKGEILEVYKVLSYKQSEERPNRVEFELKEVESTLKGKLLKTKTSNPCTIIDEPNF